MWTSPEVYLFILVLGFLERIAVLQSKGLLGCVTCAVVRIEVVPQRMLAVQSSLELLALALPGLTPEGAHKPEGLVEDRVHLEDGNGEEFKNLLHNT